MKFRLLLIAFLFGLNSFSQELKFNLEGYVTEESSKKPIWGANVKLVGSDNTSREIKTDSLGYYSFSSPAVKPNTSYVVSASGLDAKRTCDFPNGFLGNPKGKISTAGDSVSKNFRQDFVLVKLRHCGWRMPMITFNKNSDSLLPGQIQELEIMIKILNENSNITIELNSHSSYDETKPDSLSFYRAKKVVDYLLAKGVAPERITPAAYSASKPFVTYGDSTAPGGKIIPSGTILNKQWIEKNLSDKNDREYARHLSRRIGFSILRMDYCPEKRKN